MTFLRHKKQNSFKYSVFAVVCATVVLFSLILFKINIVEGFVSKLISRINFFRPGDELIQRFTASFLSEKISGLERENQLLRESLGLPDQGSEIPAKVTLGGGYIFSDALYINAGADSGIRENDLAVSEEKIFIGKVSETGENWSRISPIGTLGSKVALRLGENKEITVEATGLGRGELIAELPKDTVIMSDQIVWLGERPELSAGLIAETNKVEGREIQNIIIKSPLPFGSLLNILIIKIR